MTWPWKASWLKSECLQNYIGIATNFQVAIANGRELEMRLHITLWSSRSIITGVVLSTISFGVGKHGVSGSFYCSRALSFPRIEMYWLLHDLIAS